MNIGSIAGDRHACYDTISLMQRIRQYIERQSTQRVAIALFVLAALFALPTVTFGFIALDDNMLILNNPLLRTFNLPTLKHIFTSFDPELYVPLTTLSFNLSYMIGGLEPWIYHLTNGLLFAVNSALVFVITEKLSHSRWIGILTATVFLVHPINAEAMAWASARKDLLSACFFLTSILFWIKESDDGDRRWYFLSLATFALALLSKATAVTLPIVLILIECWKPTGTTQKQIAIRTAPFFALSMAFGMIALLGKSKNIIELSTVQTALIAVKSTAFMFWNILLPINLSVLYPQNAISDIGEFTLPLIFLGILLTILMLTMQRKRAIFLCILFPLITFAPNFFTFVKNGELSFFSDRYAYLPSIGIFLLITMALRQLASKWPRTIAVGTITLLLTLGTLSQLQAQTWKDSFTLLTYTLQLNPDSALAHNNLGTILMDRGDDEGALKEFDLAIKSNPQLMNAWINRGNVLSRRGDLTGAAKANESAIKVIDTTKPIKPDDLLGYYASGERLEKEGKIDEAIKQFTDAAALAPTLAEPQYNAAVMLYKHGRIEQAVDYYTRAVALDPHMLDARYALAAILASRGLLPEAAKQLKAIIDIDPNYAEAAAHLQKIDAILGN